MLVFGDQSDYAYHRKEKIMSKARWNLWLACVVITTMALAACQPQTIVVEKQVMVTQIVKETVKETVIVKGTPQVVEKSAVKVKTQFESKTNLKSRK